MDPPGSAHGHPDLIVCSVKENSIGLQRVKESYGRNNEKSIYSLY